MLGLTIGSTGGQSLVALKGCSLSRGYRMSPGKRRLRGKDRTDPLECVRASDNMRRARPELPKNTTTSPPWAKGLEAWFPSKSDVSPRIIVGANPNGNWKIDRTDSSCRFLLTKRLYYESVRVSKR